jgi:hypothetical protein
VVDSPWFARSDAAGRLALRDLPDGAYRLNLWHPGQLHADAARAIEIGPGATERSIQLEATEIPALLKAALAHGGHGEKP